MAHIQFDYTDETVLIVGASRGGIGLSIARAFHDAGATVTITGAEPEPLGDASGLTYHQLDVTDGDAIAALAAGFPKLTTLVNGAAITRRGEEMAPDFFSKVLDINLTGSLRTASAFHPALKAAGGSVVNIASMYSAFGSPKNPAYGASKAGVRQLTQSLAIAWAPDGIRVNAIAPGFIVTEQSARSRQDPVHVANVEARTPLGRWGEPDDLAGTVLYLASDAARFVTGTTIAVDGGYSVV